MVTKEQVKAILLETNGTLIEIQGLLTSPTTLTILFRVIDLWISFQKDTPVSNDDG